MRCVPRLEYNGSKWNFTCGAQIGKQQCLSSEITTWLLTVVYRHICEHFHVELYILSEARTYEAISANSARRL